MSGAFKNAATQSGAPDLEGLRRIIEKLSASMGIPASEFLKRATARSLPCGCKNPKPGLLPYEFVTPRESVYIAVTVRPMRTGDLAGICPACGTSHMISQAALEWLAEVGG